MGEKQRIFPEGNKSSVHKRSLVGAVPHIAKINCQRRLLPYGYPKWNVVKSFYYWAAANGTWEKVMEYLVRETRVWTPGRSDNPSYALKDSQSVKTTSASDNCGYDGEKTKGRKRHIVTEIMGNLLAVRIHAVNIHDMKGGAVVISFALAKKFYPSIEAVCADEGYRSTFKRLVETTFQQSNPHSKGIG